MDWKNPIASQLINCQKLAKEEGAYMASLSQNLFQQNKKRGDFMSKLVNPITKEGLEMIIEGERICREGIKSNKVCFPTIEEHSKGCINAFPIYAGAMEKILSEKDVKEDGRSKSESENQNSTGSKKNYERPGHSGCCGRNCCGKH